MEIGEPEHSGAIPTRSGTGLCGGAGNTSEPNSENNPADNTTAEDVVVGVFGTAEEKVAIQGDYKGGDSESNLKAATGLESAWLAGCVLDHTMTYVGYDGQSTKCMLQHGWGAWLKSLADELGNVCGSVPRCVSTYVVSSWQTSPLRDPVSGCPAGMELIT